MCKEVERMIMKNGIDGEIQFFVMVMWKVKGVFEMLC